MTGPTMKITDGMQHPMDGTLCAATETFTQPVIKAAENVKLKPELLSCAPEIIYEIIRYLALFSKQPYRDIASFVQVNKRLYSFSNALYIYDIKNDHGLGIYVAAARGSVKAVQTFFELNPEHPQGDPHRSEKRLSQYGRAKYKFLDSIRLEPIHYAAAFGKVDVVKLMMYHPLYETRVNDKYDWMDETENARTNKLNRRGTKAVFLAIRYGHESVVHALLHNAEVDPCFSYTINLHSTLGRRHGKKHIKLTALHLACHFKLPRLVRWMLEQGADPHFPCSSSKQALRYALDDVTNLHKHPRDDEKGDVWTSYPPFRAKPSLADEFETVKAVVRYVGVPSLEGSFENHTAKVQAAFNLFLGSRHENRKIRGLFTPPKLPLKKKMRELADRVLFNAESDDFKYARAVVEFNVGSRTFKLVDRVDYLLCKHGFDWLFWGDLNMMWRVGLLPPGAFAPGVQS